MYTLGELADSELDLLGAMTEDQFLGALDAADAKDKKKFFKKAKKNSRIVATPASNRSRGEFERRIALLPKEIQEGLAKQTLQAVDTAYYVVKEIGGSKVIKMFKDDDNKVVGLANISSGKLEKGNYMLLWGLQILSAEDTLAVGNPYGLHFDVIPDYLRNGEFEIKANGAVLVPNSAMSIFDSYPKTLDKGLYILDNPKILKDQHPIELNLEWAVNAPTDTYIKVILRGTAVIKA